MAEEMKIYNKDIDVKFTKLSKPSFNTLDLPLSGLYNNIDSVEFSNFPLKNKFKNFGVSSPDYIGTEHLFQINSSFIKLLAEEVIEGLVILTNVSNRDIIISNLEIYFHVEGITIKKEKSDEQLMTKLPINLPGVNNSLLLLPKQSHSILIKYDLKHSSKYIINVIFRTKSPFYNQIYYELKQKKNINNSKISKSKTFETGKRKDRYGNMIIHGGKQKVTFIDRVSNYNFTEVVKVENYKEYNKMEEPTESGNRGFICCFLL